MSWNRRQALRRGRDRRTQRGFTLVEVMVALAIVAIAVPALLFTLDQQVDGTAYLRDRSVAQVVASNRLTELRLALRAGQRRLSGSLSGSESLAERDWYWRVRTIATEVPNFSRVEIEVRDREEDAAQPLYTLVAFLAAGVES
jgi:general secretion pathway protein I